MMQVHVVCSQMQDNFSKKDQALDNVIGGASASISLG